MGLLDAPAAPPPQGLLSPAASQRRLTREEWNARTPEWRAYHPEQAPEEGAAAVDTTDWTNYGGEKAAKGGNEDPSKDLRGFASLGDYFNDPGVQKDGRALIDMITGVSPVGAALGIGGMGKEQMGPSIPSFGMNDAVADEIGSAAIGGGGLGSMNTDPSAPGLFAKGGRVGRRGLLDVDPPGPDNVVIGAKTGERVLNEKQFADLSKEAKAEVERVLKGSKK